jgi:hypothetical protein
VASSERPTIIYVLTEPDTGNVRYVGQTRHLFRRYAWHLASLRGNSPKVQWLTALERRAVLPGLQVLEAVIKEDAGTRERWWIQYWQEQGAQLLNSAPAPAPTRAGVQQWTIRLSGALIEVIKTEAAKERLQPSHLLEAIVQEWWEARKGLA